MILVENYWAVVSFVFCRLSRTGMGKNMRLFRKESQLGHLLNWNYSCRFSPRIAVCLATKRQPSSIRKDKVSSLTAIEWIRYLLRNHSIY